MTGSCLFLRYVHVLWMLLIEPTSSKADVYKIHRLYLLLLVYSFLLEYIGGLEGMITVWETTVEWKVEK